MISTIVSGDRGTTRACADDIGLVVRSLKYIPLLQLTLDQITRGASLALNFTKCVLVPLWQLECVEFGERHLRRWLAAQESGCVGGHGHQDVVDALGAAHGTTCHR